MKGKQSFVLWIDILEILDELDEVQTGRIFRAIIAYVKGEEYELSKLERVVFIPIRQRLERDFEKWEVTKEKRSEAGKRGGRPKALEVRVDDLIQK